jgi:hypothetical protein
LKATRQIHKDRIGAILLVLLGGTIAFFGYGYGVGRFESMGAGFMPVALGILMAVVGLLIGATATLSSAEGTAADAESHGARGLDVRAWLCILGGIAAFVVLGDYGGLVPATFVGVFIAAMGDRSNSARDALLLAGALVVVALVIFSWALKLQMPAFKVH